MDLLFYKNIRVSEYIRMSKKKTQKIHRKSMWFESGKDKNTAAFSLISTNYLSTDKRRCFEAEDREPTASEMAQFIERMKKPLTRWLVEKSFCEEITDDQEMRLCEMLGVFGYKEPSEFIYFEKPINIMKKTLNLKDGVAEIGQTIWYVDTSFEDLPELKSIVLSESDFIHEDAYFNEIFDDNSPCFVTKAALLDYCQENNIECVELERDVYRERLESMGTPKTDIEKFLALCDDFEIETNQTLMTEKSGNTHGSFISISDAETETRFVFGLYGDFKNFYSLLED